MQKPKKSLTDSILLSKGLPQIQKKLMPWRKIVYILLSIEIFSSIIFFCLEIFFTITEDADNNFFFWLILSVVFNVLILLYEWSVLIYVEQVKLRCGLRLYYLILMNVLAASLTQSIDQFINPEDYLIEANLYFEILSLTCGTFIFIIGVFRIIIYHRVILKMDLKGKEKFIKQAVNSTSNNKMQKLIKKADVFKTNGEMNSPFEPFTYKQQKKPFNIDNT